MYADVVFPLKLPPLTYKVPENAPHDLNGRIVKAPLMGKSHYGIVVSVKNELRLEKKKNMKEIIEIHQHFASESTLSFLKWLSDYYLMPMGIALKSSFFEEATSATVRQCDSATVWKKCGKEKKYNTFLFHASSISDEYSFLFKTLSDTSHDMHSAIILVPEVGQIERLQAMLKNIFSERVCILHSNLTKKKRIGAIARIISGQSDIVIGARSAILAPIRDVSFIAVLNEHSPSYKGEEGLRYNARDVAVMRGFMEKSCVILSSVCPSVESVYNAKIGKYSPIAPSPHLSAKKRPKIKIVDSKANHIRKEFSNKVTDYGSGVAAISRDILKEAKNITARDGRFLFLINRKGYSLIRCEDCGHIARCNKCGIPLVFYKGRNTVRCHYCGHEETVPESCKECKGFNIKPFGTGIERIKEKLGEALKVEAILVEKGHGSWVMGQDSDTTSFVIGTPYAARKLRDERFDAIALFNIDGLLSQPDFRAYERAFQEVIQISQMVKTEGSLYLQTWNPKNKILRFIKNYDFQGFYEYELSQRKALDYPPFSRIILFNVFMKRDAERFLHDMQKIICDTNTNGLELLGPVVVPSTMKSFNYCIHVLLKSKDRKLIHNEAGSFLKKIEKLKGIKINVNVDPLKI
jgi:primosomal protein N' (replication factor Y)